MQSWSPPSDWLRITTLDLHTAGEPFRVVTGGFPELPGKSILDRRRHAMEHLDHLRKALMWEPRGHADMYGCIVVPPVSPQADFGVVFMHNEGYSTMCGHGIIAIAKEAVETGRVSASAPVAPVNIDTPAGFVAARAFLEGGRVLSTAFQNVPSFVAALDETVDVPGVGSVRYDLAFGGAFYAYVEAADVGLSCTPENFADLVRIGRQIKRAVAARGPVRHPFEADLGFLYGTIFVDRSPSQGIHSRNVCVFADGEVDRSPTGTGVSGRLAIHHARGEIEVGQTLTVESIIGTRFVGKIVRAVPYGPHRAVIPEIEGTAYITGRNEFLIDPADPLREGFILR
jgi:trans-L-3-hydroxyproline dehydratase